MWHWTGWSLEWGTQQKKSKTKFRYGSHEKWYTQLPWRGSIWEKIVIALKQSRGKVGKKRINIAKLSSIVCQNSQPNSEISHILNIHVYTIFSSPDPKGQVSYSHHLASVVVRRKLFQKSSPLKVLDQWKPSLVWIITV